MSKPAESYEGDGEKKIEEEMEKCWMVNGVLKLHATQHLYEYMYVHLLVDDIADFIRIVSMEPESVR